MDKMKAVQFYVQYPQKRLKVYRMERDDRAIDNYLQLALAFWELVEKEIPPEPQTEVEANQSYFNHNKVYMPFDSKVGENVKRLMDLEVAEKHISDEKKKLRLAVKKAIARNAGMDWPHSNENVQLQRYVRPSFNEDSFFEKESDETINDYSVTSIDKSLLRKENRELYDKHSETKEITRLVLPKK
jgi:hypothetical protein